MLRRFPRQKYLLRAPTLDSKRLIKDRITCSPSEVEKPGTELIQRVRQSGAKKTLDEILATIDQG